MYVNLFPNIAPPTAFTNGSYEAYIRAFLTDFPLSYVSQDFYPIDIDARGRKNVSEQYYASLSVMCRAARDAGKEAWMYIYTMRDTVNAVKDYEPTLADVRFEANTLWRSDAIPSLTTASTARRPTRNPTASVCSRITSARLSLKSVHR